MEYTLTDHLGSTSITTGATGKKVSQTKYYAISRRDKPWGELRGPIWTSDDTTNAMTNAIPFEPIKRTFTDQYSYYNPRSAAEWGVSDFGLHFYNARWYDSSIGRFAQADTIVPGGFQGLDRYAYVNNNPANFTDPSGHSADCGPDGVYCDDDPSNDHDYDVVYKKARPLLTFETEGNEKFTEKEKKVFQAKARAVAKALANEMNAFCQVAAEMEGAECDEYSPTSAFYEVFGGSITVKRVSADCGCWAEHRGKVDGHYEIWIYKTTSEQEILTHPNLIIHEIGHAFYAVAGGFIEGSSVGDRDGFYAGRYSWQFGGTYPDDALTNDKEIFADMFLGWVYGKWQLERGSTSLSVNGAAKAAYMDKYMPLMINKALER